MPIVSVPGRRLAAVLACGPGAVLSHRSAAAHWGIRNSSAGRIDVALPRTGGCRSRPGLAIHRLGSLHSDEVTTHRVVPITTPARTLLDLATAIERRALERAVEEAERLKLFDLSKVESLLQARRGRPGSAALATVLQEHRIGTTLTRNELEEQLLALCDVRGLERPVVNARLLGFEVDFLWRHHGLVVETDGHASHGMREAFARDRARDARLTAAGYRVVRFTYRQVQSSPAAVADVLTSLLRRPSA